MYHYNIWLLIHLSQTLQYVCNYFDICFLKQNDKKKKTQNKKQNNSFTTPALSHFSPTLFLQWIIKLTIYTMWSWDINSYDFMIKL